MADDLQSQTASVEIETQRLRAELAELNRLSDSFGNSISTAFAGAIVSGRRLSDVLRGLLLTLSRQALTAALRPFGNMLGGLLGSLFGPITANAKGNLLAAGRVVPFANGGIVGSPTLFPLRGGVGLMGERGAEAILPLARGPDGSLGVRAGGGRAVNITVNISTPDVTGFERSQSQVSAMIARAVQRGQRNL